MRHQFVDIAKGLAILLVVVGHSWRGLHSARVVASDSLFLALDGAIYAFHMPVFFVASALFFRASGKFASAIPDRAFRLLLPLLVWSWVQAAAQIAAGGNSNAGAPTLAEALLSPFPPKSVFWFLFALFLAQTTADAIERLRPKPLRIAVYVLAGCLSATAAETFLNDTWMFNELLHLPYFFAGILIAPLILRHHPRFITIAAWVAFAVVVILGGSLAPLRDVPVTAVIVLGLAGAVACLLSCKTLEGTSAAQFLGYLGQRSFAIYVCHIIFTAGFRAVLLKLGTENAAIHLAVGSAAGLLFPLGLLELSRRLGISNVVMLDPPRLPRRRASTQA